MNNEKSRKENEMKSESTTLQKIKIKEPSQYKIIFINDDFTPMDFVIVVLEQIYNFDETSAHVKMMRIHNEGSAVIGTYSYAIAETKKTLTDNFSRKYGYPLEVKIEEDK